MMKEWLLTHINTRVQKTILYLEIDSLLMIRVRVGAETISFGAAHTYIAHIREYPSSPSRGGGGAEVTVS